MKLTEVRVDDLVLDPRNARTHDKRNLETIGNSLDQFGQVENVVVHKASRRVIGGNGRVMAMQAKGTPTVHALEVDCSEAQANKMALALNRTAQLAGWDKTNLGAIVEELVGEGIEVADIGFNDAELADLIGLSDIPIEANDDDVAEPSEGEAVTKVGDIWQLGDHRVMCGDSTCANHVNALMAGITADICFTSPPYNQSKNSHLNGRVDGFGEKYCNVDDALDDTAYFELLRQSTQLMLDNSRYAFFNLQLLAHNRVPLMQYQAAFADKVKDVLVWVKAQCPPNIVKGAFNTKWEYVFCFSNDNVTRGFPCSWRGQYANVIETEANCGNENADVHRAGFPVALPVWFLHKMPFAKTMVDPFLGSGTSIIAAERTKRVCYGLELNPKYADVTVERWQNATGGKAVKVAHG